ncbi:MAG: hypothetical protein MJ137_03525 [Clostridia bacterium]|nr:hypothetical protein [Clostridia bacterium]
MNKFIEWIKTGKIMMAAHRGDKDCRPENTIPAFLHAIELNADGIETDIHQTRDGVLVMMHDHDVDRTTDGTGRVCDMTLEEIKKLDAGIKKGEEYRGTRVPTFEEFLDVVEPYPDLLLNLEIKDYPDVEGDICYSTADKVIEAVERRGMGDRIMFNCFSWQVLKYVHEKYGDKYPLHGFYPDSLMRKPQENVYPYLTYACLFPCVKKADGTADWSPRKVNELCTPEQFREVKDTLGVEPCVCFIKDTPELMKKAVEMGATMFTCNNPERAIAILKELGLRD